ncbi:MAG: ComEC/Rec2 family competence protein, partial [Nannocystaceae bacterium]|nr:ComEC/Rec2 family competence protein [Nannocystaceae bacterium]
AWVLVMSGVAGGLLLGSASPLPAGWIVVLLALAATALAGARIAHRWGGLVFGLALVLLGLARGASAEQAAQEIVVADRRGLAPRTRSLTVDAASTPGPTCRVVARTARGTQVVLALPADACPLWWGERVAVLSADLHTDSARTTPDSRILVFVTHVWRHPAPTRRPWTDRIRARVSRGLAQVRQSGWDEARGYPARGFVVASSLGLSAALPPNVRAELQRAGLGHLIAISGLHVGLAAWAWLAALRWALAPWSWGARTAVTLSVLPVVAYVVLTGAAAPAVRAAVMFGLVVLSSVVGRPTHSPTILLVAAAGMLLARPHWLMDPGFQLSIAAMVVLVGLPSTATASFTSWHLGWALLPLLWLHFDAASDGSVIANAVAMPVFSLWVVPLAVLGWALVPIFGGIALDPAAAGAALILDVARLVSSLPEIPRWAWVCGAALVWVPGVRTRMSASSRAWLPHRGAALLLLCAAAASLLTDVPVPGWVAWSTARDPEVLGVRPDGLACVRAPSASAARWRARLQSVRASTLWGVQQSPRVSIQDPASLAWRAAVSRVPAPRGVPRCSLPNHAEVREALLACSPFSSFPTARRRDGAAVECWSARLGAWRPAPIQS